MLPSLSLTLANMEYSKENNSLIKGFFNGLAAITDEDDKHKEVMLLLERLFTELDSTILFADLVDEIRDDWFDILNDKAKSDFELVQNCIMEHWDNLFTKSLRWRNKPSS